MICIGRYSLGYLPNGVSMRLSRNRQKLPCVHILPVPADILCFCEHQSPSVSTHSVSSLLHQLLNVGVRMKNSALQELRSLAAGCELLIGLTHTTSAGCCKQNKRLDVCDALSSVYLFFHHYPCISIAGTSQTSIHALHPESSSNSPGVSSTALLALPHAG